MKRKKSKRQKMLGLFLRSACITLVVGIILVAGFLWSYKHFIYKGDSGSDKGITGIFESKKPINKTLAVLGVDRDGYRTDVIFLVNFNSETNKVKVVSIPRDTRVEWTDEQTQKVKDMKGYNITVSKINEMSSYSGIENLRDFTLPHLEEMTDLKVDNYVVISLDAFRQIVDAIDGVEVNVPMRMYYQDPVQNLYIDLQEGVQTLNGEQAEMLVRFRKGYAEGDVGRIRTQQLFLEAFAKKVMSPEIITKIPQIIPVIFSSVKTDAALNDMTSYYKYMKEFDINNLSFDILPGDGQMMGGKSYFVIDEGAMPEFLDRLHDRVLDPSEIVVDKAVSIEVLNGSGVQGAAGKAKETLEAEGYSVQNVGNYQEDMQRTTIYAKDTAKAAQFKTYFTSATIEEKTDLTTDIQIVIGTV